LTTTAKERDQAEEQVHFVPRTIMARRNSRILNLEQYENLLAQAESEIRSTETDLEDARELMQKAGLSTEGELSKANTAASTGGHSNTDHLVVLTGDYTLDRITELRRRYLVRQRAEQPESRGEDRWDKPRVPGERRRRIAREKDLPTAPPEPPLSGYIVFLGQMTTKIRHDRPDEPHDQSKVMQEISRMWRMKLSERERNYYNAFSDECRKEYKYMQREFRATGYYTPSDRFEKLGGAGLWVHKKIEERNELEVEVDSYDTVVFPMRPPEMDEDYMRRDRENKERRKAKMRAERAAQGKRQRKRRRKGDQPQEQAQPKQQQQENSKTDSGEASESNSAN